jgi:DNA-binding NarL/FixJ family response regulator
MKNFILIDPDQNFRAELERVIHFQPNWQCILSMATFEESVQKLKPRLQFDVALINLNLHTHSGLQLIPYLTRIVPNAEIIILDQEENSESLIRAFELGATGYLQKNFSPLQLPEMVNTLKSGGALISPRLARKLVNYFNPRKNLCEQAISLSPKEEQTLSLLSSGQSYEEAAACLGISLDGIRFRVKSIYKKLNVKKLSEAAYKYRTGRVSSPS